MARSRRPGRPRAGEGCLPRGPEGTPHRQHGRDGQARLRGPFDHHFDVGRPTRISSEPSFKPTSRRCSTRATPTPTSECGEIPTRLYGGRSLQTRSHGETFLAILRNRIRSGLLLFDEPESALSPQRQLALLAHKSALVATGTSQFIIATHSPILLTFPGAQILSFDGDALRPISLEDTSHFQITNGILQNPTVYCKHLNEKADAPNEPLRNESRKPNRRRVRRPNG